MQPCCWARGKTRIDTGTRINDRWPRFQGNAGRHAAPGFECVRVNRSRFRWQLHPRHQSQRRRRCECRCNTRCAGRHARCSHSGAGHLGSGIILSHPACRHGVRRQACWRLRRFGLRRIFRAAFCCRGSGLSNHHHGLIRRGRRRRRDCRLVNGRLRLMSCCRREVCGCGRRLRRSCLHPICRQAGQLGRNRIRKRDGARRIAGQVPEDESSMQQPHCDQQPDDGDVDFVRHRDPADTLERPAATRLRRNLYRQRRARCRVHPPWLAHGGIEGGRSRAHARESARTPVAVLRIVPIGRVARLAELGHSGLPREGQQR